MEKFADIKRNRAQSVSVGDGIGIYACFLKQAFVVCWKEECLDEEMEDSDEESEQEENVER